MDRSTVNKLQRQYWVTKQTVYRKLGKKEDECITASDSELDAKLELYKSIHQSSNAMNKLLDRYQEKICALAQEQNEMGRFLKEYGKSDKTPAGKMMIQMGKSLIYSSQQEIALRPPLLRLYQEVETFRNRAVEDTHGTIQQMEKNRTEYRASLNWMKKISQELDPDTNKQMEKFRKVQNHVKSSKVQFDKLKLACLQKVDLLAAARCNMFSHALIQYLQSMLKTTAKNAKIFNTLAITFKGHQYFEFSYIKELAEPSKRLAEECGNTKPATEELLFDFNDELNQDREQKSSTTTDDNETGSASKQRKQKKFTKADLVDLECASELLETLLGPLDQSPETEKAQDALDFNRGLEDLPTSSSASFPSETRKGEESKSLINIGSFTAKKEQKKDGKSEDVMSLISTDEFAGLSFEPENEDTMKLLSEILNVGNNPSGALSNTEFPFPLSSSSGDIGVGGDTSKPLSPFGASTAPPQLLPLNSSSSQFMPSYLLDLGNINFGTQGAEMNLLNLSGQPAMSSHSKDKTTTGTSETASSSNAKTWYDIFADLDPLGNPDAIGDKEKADKEMENRYC